MEEVTLVAEAGRTAGSRPARRLRRAGRVPAVLYGHGLSPVSLSVDGRSLRGALTTPAGVNALITLDVGGRKHLAMARELQRDPVRGTVNHVDFVVVRRDEVVSADVPIQLVGEAAEVHAAGGLIDQSRFSLPIAAMPADIPPVIEVDLSGLRVGDTVRVGDLKLPSGVRTDVDPEEAVVSAQGPQAVEVPEVAEGEVAEGLPVAASGGEGGGRPEPSGV